MQLNTADRLCLLELLPRRGDMTTLRIIRDLEKELSFTEEDHKRLKFRNENGGVFWDPKGDTLKDIEFGPRASMIVHDALMLMEKRKDLPIQMMALYERFVEEPEESDSK